jgi:hypothetical protein
MRIKGFGIGDFFTAWTTLISEQKRQQPTWVCGKWGLTEVIEH